MSDDYIRLIPVDPTFVPDLEAQEKAKAFFKSIVPGSDDISACAFISIQFIDAGSHFEGVCCPICKQELALSWWAEVMDIAALRHFSKLELVLPCCNSKSSLNNLDYRFPQGFASFILEARNPNIKSITNNCQHGIESILGCSIRVIYAHY